MKVCDFIDLCSVNFFDGDSIALKVDILSGYSGEVIVMAYEKISLEYFEYLLNMGEGYEINEFGSIMVDNKKYF